MKFIKILLISILVIIVSFLLFFWYSGFFSTIKIEEKQTGPFHILYRELIIDYPQADSELEIIMAELSSKGYDVRLGAVMFYGNEGRDSGGSRKCMIGVVVEPQDIIRIGRAGKQFRHKLIGRQYSIVASFPYTNHFSIFAGHYKAYPAIRNYCYENNYPPEPILELHDQPGRTINYIMKITGN